MIDLEDSILQEEDRKIDDIYQKYFHQEGESLLEVKKEVLEKVREDVEHGNTLNFEPTIKLVIRDLAFVHFNGLWESEVFKHYRETMSSDGISNSKKHREKARLQKFFGEEVNDSDAKRLNYRAQPGHVKRYRLDRIFGEKPSIDYVPDITDENEEEDEEIVRVRARRAMSAVEWRKSRRLHVFFGAPFPIEEVVYSEKVRSSSVIGDFITRPLRRQPTHVHPHRLNRFFGERVKDRNDNSLESEMVVSDEGDDQKLGYSNTCHGPRYPRTLRIQRFFGERMDPKKEASTVSFADQPPHVKGHRLRKIFGTPPVSNTDMALDEDDMEDIENSNQNGPSLEMKRAHKLRKFFGTKVDEDIQIEVPEKNK